MISELEEDIVLHLGQKACVFITHPARGLHGLLNGLGGVLVGSVGEHDERDEDEDEEDRLDREPHADAARLVEGPREIEESGAEGRVDDKKHGEESVRPRGIER